MYVLTTHSVVHGPAASASNGSQLEMYKLGPQA